MKVEAMLAAKGDKVVTARPDAAVATIVRMLMLEGIGALVISEDGEGILGIVSERDVVRALVEHGGEVLRMKVADLMTSSVKTCAPEANIKDVMAEMTRSRVRHLPVVRNGKLCGIISIGDVVKNRLEELETETSVLRDYIVGRG
jgi:CBS domain-containing protein